MGFAYAVRPVQNNRIIKRRVCIGRALVLRNLAGHGEGKFIGGADNEVLKGKAVSGRFAAALGLTQRRGGEFRRFRRFKTGFCFKALRRRRHVWHRLCARSSARRWHGLVGVFSFARVGRTRDNNLARGRDNIMLGPQALHIIKILTINFRGNETGRRAERDREFTSSGQLQTTCPRAVHIRAKRIDKFSVYLTPNLMGGGQGSFTCIEIRRVV